MRTRQVLVPATATRLFDLIDSDNLSDEFCGAIGLQADSGNAGSVFFGSRGSQTQELTPGNSSYPSVHTPKNVWVKSENGTELLNVTPTV